MSYFPFKLRNETDFPASSLAKSRARGVPVRGAREGPAITLDQFVMAGWRTGAEKPPICANAGADTEMDYPKPMLIGGNSGSTSYYAWYRLHRTNSTY